MYKKYVAAVSLCLIGFVLLFAEKIPQVKFDSMNPVSSVMAEEIWENKVRVERFEFDCLMCNGIQLPVDYIEKTFYVPLNMETDQWETLEFTSGNPELQILFQEDFTEYNKREIIAEGTDIKFLVYNDTEFSTYHLIFTGLPVIDIATREGIDNQKEISGNAVFYGTDFSAQGIQTSEYQAHVRGNTSTLYPKKGYKLNLIKQNTNGITEQNKLSLFDMRKDDDWILYALYNDESKLRAKLSIDLWNEMGAKVLFPNVICNTNLSYVELIVDEAYYGMYALMEPVDAKQLNLKAEDYLFKRKEQNILSPEPFAQAKNTDDYVLGVEIKAGESREDGWYLMADLASNIVCEDETFIENVGNVIDEENAIRLWLYLQIISGVDQVYKNTFYVAKKEGNTYRFYFIPWDFDLTWGNISSGEEPLYTVFNIEGLNMSYDWEPGNRLVRLDVNGSAEKMETLYRQYREGILSDESIEDRIAALDHIIRDSGAYLRDQIRWPQSACADDCNVLINYAKERFAYLDVALNDLERY